MRAASGLSKYPQKRLIVFAGANGPDRRLHALANRKVDSILGSFVEVRRAREKRTARYIELLDSWPQYRYLDSGVFTFTSRGLERREGLTNASIAARDKRKDEVKTVTVREVVEHVRAYIDYLERHLDMWDFVFECDLDPISLVTESGSLMPGSEFTLWSRDKLKAAAGEKLIPVWHPITENLETLENLHAILASFRYVGIGSSRDGSRYVVRQACELAHDRGVLVHGLGTSREDALREFPFDTVDSTHWISGGKFGMYAKTIYTDRRELSQREIRKARSFEEEVRALGYDPQALIGETPDSLVQYELGAALLQARQDAAPPIHLDDPE